jgi:RHS repeat-associated protein
MDDREPVRTMTAMLRTLLRTLAAAAIAVLPALPAAAGTVTYFHNDLAGSPVVATDASGQVLWRESYRPYGERLTHSPAASGNTVWFTSRRQDAETGLVYMGARYYDPVAGRFVSPDPVGFEEPNLHSFNRYAYANNNPYRYKDPDGRAAETILDVVSFGISLEMFRRDPTVGNFLGAAVDGIAVAVPFLPGGVGSIRALGRSADSVFGASTETTTVQRWMSKGELDATQNTGLLRGGREGTHYVTDAANSDPLRARQRLALPQTPEVRATMEVPTDALSAPSKIRPAFNMPGGGMERTASGNVPVKIIRVD